MRIRSSSGAGRVFAVGELAGQVAVVTGGARGIGRAAAAGLARAGASIAIFDRVLDEAERVNEELTRMGNVAMTVGIDLGELSQIPSAVESVVAALGRIDILVNCAGVQGGPGTILDLDLDTWERTHRIDLTAPFLMMQNCARQMIRGGRGGRIVNITSSSAFRAARTQIDYTSAKAAMVGMSRSAAAQLAPYDINVNCVAPGMTATSMAAGLGPEELLGIVSEGPLANLFQRVSMPEDVASAVVFLCLPGSRQITAQTIHTSAGTVV
jgi:NAD(P)-dependent dehydrogenase (short-subunit alcohol dehydrogenase family)